MEFCETYLNKATKEICEALEDLSEAAKGETKTQEKLLKKYTYKPNVLYKKPSSSLKKLLDLW